MVRVLSRRAFLRGSGVCLALPWLDAMWPAFGRETADRDTPRRLVAIETNMGILPQFFFPEKPGRNYKLTPYLNKLAAHRENLTVFSGVSFPGVSGGHIAEKCFLTGTPYPERAGFRNGVSVDQVAVEHIGNRTRYPSLVLALNSGHGQTLSFTRSGAPIPAEGSARKLFETLFIQGDSEKVAAQVEELRRGRSTLDFISEQSRRLQRSLSASDQQRMDQYYSSVRELEQRMQDAEAWEERPKPVVTAKPPMDIQDPLAFVKKMQLMFDVIKLALETDSTRLVTLFINTGVIHHITHHGNRPEALNELRGHEERQFDALNGLLSALTDTKEQGDTLLNRTMVLYGSCMGSANSHSNVNLPVLLAGGGFRHGQHLAFNPQKNYDLSHLHLSLLHRLGVDAPAFSAAKGTMTGMEPR